MSTILRVLHPVDGIATDIPDLLPSGAHPDAIRYRVGLYYVDAIGEPTEEEIGAIINPPDMAVTAQTNGLALDERQKQAAKDEAVTLARAGDLSAAFSKLVELL